MTGANDLAQEVERIMKAEKRFGWLNSSAQYAVATLAIAGSISGSLLAAFDADRWLISVVALIPAAVAAITKVFPFETRALAHWRKEYRLHGLLWKLKYEQAEVSAISAEFREIEARTFDEWPLLTPATGPRPAGKPFVAQPD